jgi:hypothetical protein
MLAAEKQFSLAWVDRHLAELSDWNQVIWHYAETALREYKSAAWYVERLRREGFEVEAGSGGMPTAFVAEFRNGEGPVIGAYAEYDAVPGNCQAAATRRMPRPGLSRHAAGHTDPHSALGIGALGGALAAKAAMQQFGIKGTLRFFGEPAEKLRLSKPVHAAKGYYDGVDAFISFHPTFMLPLANTVRWDTRCGAAYLCIYSFECDEPETWLADVGDHVMPAYHSGARAPGANDALFLMFSLGKQLHRSDDRDGEPLHRRHHRRPADPARSAPGGAVRIRAAHRRRGRGQGLDPAAPRARLPPADRLSLAGIRHHGTRRGVVESGLGRRVVSSSLPSFRRKPESIAPHLDVRPWMPAFAGMTRLKGGRVRVAG